MENIDQSILLQFAKFSRGFKISDFEEFIKEIGIENLTFFGRLAYPNQWQMGLSKPGIREDLLRKGRTRINYRSCWIYPLNQQEIRGFVRWLPNSVTNEQLTELLKQYGHVLFIESQKQTIRGREVKSEPRYYGMVLNQETAKEDIPHFLSINGYLCLIVIRGRAPACFSCKKVGHILVQCPKYKSKMVGYCKRDSNTALPRIKPRGRRHVNRKTEINEETGGETVYSNTDMESLQTAFPVGEANESQSLNMEDEDQVIKAKKGATSSIDKKLAVSGVLTSRGAKTSVSSPEIKTLDIVETLQQIQRRAANELQQSLKNFENSFTSILVRDQVSNKEQETQTMSSTPKESSTLAKISGCDSNVDMDEKKSKSEMASSFLIMHQVEEDIKETIEGIREKSEEIVTETMASSTSKESSTLAEISECDSNVDIDEKKSTGEMVSPFLIVHQVEEGNKETIDRIHEKSEEIVTPTLLDKSTAIDPKRDSDETKSNLLIVAKTESVTESLQNSFTKKFAISDESEFTSKDSPTDQGQNLTKPEMRCVLAKLEQAQQTALECFGKTFKKLEVKIASLSTQMAEEQSDTDTKLTENDIQFAYKVLNQAQEIAEETLEKTFKNLVEELETETRLAEVTAKSPPKTADTSRKFAVNLVEINLNARDIQFSTPDDDVVEGECSEGQSNSDPKQKETKKIESGHKATSQKIWMEDRILESSEGEKDAMTKEDLFAIKDINHPNIDELQNNIRKLFNSFLENNELHSETRKNLELVESKVSELIEKMKKIRR